MTKQEVNNLLAIMQVNYSYAFKRMSMQDKYLLLNSWTFALQDLDANVVLLACMKLLTVSKWLPTVAEIREKVRGLFYEASCELMTLNGVAGELMSDEEIARRTVAANSIISKTSHLRGDGPPELTLQSIMDNPQCAQLEQVNRQMMGLEGQTFRLEEAKEDEEF